MNPLTILQVALWGRDETIVDLDGAIIVWEIIVINWIIMDQLILPKNKQKSQQ